MVGRRGSFHPRNLVPVVCALSGLVCLVAFVFLAQLDWSGATPEWDVRIATWVQNWSFPGLLPFMLVVSWPGWSPQSWFFVASICALLYLRGLRVAAPLALLAAASHFTVRAIKESVLRVRPDLGVLRDGPLDPSFPSGHAAQYTIFLGLLGYLAWRRIPTGLPRRIIIAVCVALVVLVGPSRVFLGQHWPSDVVAGYLLGAGLVLIIIAASEWRRVPTTALQ
jgi:undecaprenyl-diphosphatase